MKKSLTVLLSILSLCVAQAGNVFYWRTQYIDNHTEIRGALPEFFEWADFGDPANWSLNQSSYNNPDGLVPGEEDSLYMLGYMQSSAGASWTMGYFDLGGKSWTVAGFSTNGCPNNSTFHYKKNIMGLTNGTLTVTNPNFIAAFAHSYRIYSGAVLIYPSGVDVTISTPSPYEDWQIKTGGRAEVKCGVSLTYLMCTVDSGATLLWNPDHFDMTASVVDGQGSSITNNGMLIAPNGFLWNGVNRSGNAEKTKEFEVAQMDGELRMGGDFTKTTEEYYNGASMRFVLGGGTLKAESDVAFKNSVAKWGDEVSASMPASAAATVDVAQDATLDMQIFTYGEGASLVKKGKGMLVVSSLPESLSVEEGSVLFMKPLTLSAGCSFASGTTISFGAADNEMAAFDGYENVEFVLGSDAFAVGSVLLKSSNETFLRYVADSIVETMPEGTRAVVSGGVLKLSSMLVEISANGKVDLSDAAVWGGEIPAGADVCVIGDSTVASFTSSTPVFKSITVAGGATLKVTGTGAVLPLVKLNYPSRLLFAENSVTDFSVDRLSSSGNADGLPVLEIAEGAEVTVPVGTGFKNVHLKLYGQVGIPDSAVPASDKGITFGTASAGEVAYFAMTADGGKIRMKGSEGTCRRFMCPENGGKVYPVGEVLLKDVTFPPYSDTAVYLGIDVGTYNEGVPFTLILDGTEMPMSQTSRIYQKAHIICRNGGKLKSPYRHPGVASAIQIRQYSKVTIDGPESGIYYPYSNKGTLTVDTYDKTGADVIELKNGGWVATHNTAATSGSPKGTLAVSNGTWRIGQLPYVPADKNPCPPDEDALNWFSRPFNALGKVRIEPDSTLWMQSSSDLEGTEWNRNLVVADVPITGLGNLVVTNAVPGYGLSLTFVSSANTATGRISVAPCPVL